MSRRATHIGRPSALKLAPEVGKAILQAIEEGTPIGVAADAQGIPEATVRSWASQGARPRAREPYRTFSRDFVCARAKGMVARMKELQELARGGQVIEERTIKHPDGREEHIVRHARGDWRALAWWFERQLPHEFGKAATIEHTGPDGSALPMMLLGELVSGDPEGQALLERLVDRVVGREAPLLLEGEIVE